MNAATTRLLLLLAGSALLGACRFPGTEPRACTDILLLNYCVQVNGAARVPDSMLVIRVMGSRADTLYGAGLGVIPHPRGNCFAEAGRAATVKLQKGGQVLVEKPVGPVGSDGCHFHDTLIQLDY